MSVVYIAYDKKPPHLPVACASTTAELADMIGLKEKTVTTELIKLKNGNSHFRYERFAMVEVNDGTND